MPHTKFSKPVVFVKDISISKKFYQEILSFEIENDFGEYVDFKNQLGIWKKKKAEEIIFGSERNNKGDTSKNVELYFESDEIDTISKKIKDNNVDIIHDIREEPWGQKTLRFYDPDNFIIEVAEPMDNVITRLAKSDMSFESISKKTQMPLDYVKKIIQDTH